MECEELGVLLIRHDSVVEMVAAGSCDIFLIDAQALNSGISEQFLNTLEKLCEEYPSSKIVVYSAMGEEYLKYYFTVFPPNMELASIHGIDFEKFTGKTFPPLDSSITVNVPIGYRLK